MAVLPAVAALAAWLSVPTGADVGASWERPGGIVAAIVVVAVGIGAASGAAAATPLGPVGTVWSLAAVAGAVVLAVPDTEGALTVLAAVGSVAVAVTAVETRHPGRWPIPAGAAGVAAGAVVVAALGGATAGLPAAVGATGCVAVLAGAAPPRRLTGAGTHPARPSMPAWASVPVVAMTAVAVARFGAVRSSTPRALVVSVLGVVVSAAVLEVAARLTSGRERPRR